MSRANAERLDSPYYPPRARWYSRVFRPWFAIQRALHLEKIHLPIGFSMLQFWLSLVIPGYAFFANDRRVLGWTFLSVYCLSLILFVVALGYQIGNVGYGLMISAHASSIIFLEGYWLREQCRFSHRLALAIVTLLVVWLAVYSPAVRFAERHWVTPVRVRNHVLIVRHSSSTQAIKRGDYVVYSMSRDRIGDGHQGGAVVMRAGLGGGLVLGVAGDRVEFSTNSFSLNGASRPLLPHMPVSGEWVVPEKHWFIWPELDMNINGNVSAAAISEMMFQLATVPEDQFVGKPFRRWFWRRQILDTNFTN